MHSNHAIKKKDQFTLINPECNLLRLRKFKMILLNENSGSEFFFFFFLRELNFHFSILKKIKESTN